jgi:serine/threonine protein phosphatase PrpC
MICSDGLYRALDDNDILSILTSDRSNPADDLVKQAMAKNHPYQDNTTVITLSIDRIL